MRTIAIANQKGGSCKTTTTVNVAGVLGASMRVLVIDLDPQANASKWLGVADGGRGLADALTGGLSLRDLPVETTAPGVQVIPSSIWLMTAEKVLSSEPGAEKILAGALKKLPRLWDVVMIDSSPFLGTLTLSALTASDELVVPVDATASGLQGTRDLIATVEKVRQRLNPKLRVTAYVPSRVNEDREVDRDVVEKLREKFGRLVTKPMHESARIKKAEMYSKPISLYAPKSSAAQEFRSLAASIARRN